MAKRTPFNSKQRKPGRPKLSPAEKKRRARFKQILAEFRDAIGDARYCIITAAGQLWKLFDEFSGDYGAKEALDLSDLPTGSAVVRASDGVELARVRKSAF